MAVTNHVTTAGAVAFIGNAVIGGIPGAAIDLITGSTLDLTPNAGVIRLERDQSLTAAMYGFEPDSDLERDGFAPGETLTVSRF